MSEYNLPYFPFHLDQWGECYSIRSLPDSTRLIFYDLLCYLWRNAGMVRNDDKEIAYNLRKLPEQWLSAKRDLIGAELIFVIQAGKMIHNPLLRLEWERVADICAKRAYNASLGGKAKAEKQRKIKGQSA
jgi:hypothetical protein